MSTRKFHFNPDTGKTGKCRAIFKCKYGQPDEAHGATEEIARANYEATMEKELFANEISNRETAKTPETPTIQANANQTPRDYEEFKEIRETRTKELLSDPKAQAEKDVDEFYQLLKKKHSLTYDRENNFYALRRALENKGRSDLSAELLIEIDFTYSKPAIREVKERYHELQTITHSEKDTFKTIQFELEKDNVTDREARLARIRPQKEIIKKALVLEKAANDDFMRKMRYEENEAISKAYQKYIGALPQ